MDLFFEQLGQIEPNTLAAFGLLLLCGVLGGMLANRVAWMPTITAFMLCGFAFGPHGINLFTPHLLDESTSLIEVALGLILYKLGAMLHPLQILRSKKLLLFSLAECGATYFIVTALSHFWGYDFFVSSLFGAIALSSSPAVLVHVSEELGAAGPVTERAKSLVALNNFISFIVFSMALPFTLSSKTVTFLDALLLPVHMLFTAGSLGLVAAWIAVRIAKLIKPRDEHYRFAVIMGSVIIVIGLSKMLQTSLLFSTLSLGMATRWFERRNSKLTHVGLSEGGDLFFIVLFVLAGAKIDPVALGTTGLFPLLLIAGRIIGKYIGVFSVKKTVDYEMKRSRALTLLLLPMAGMAIGLATTVEDVLPHMGKNIAAIIFSMVAFFEALGPFAAVRAFRLAGEIPEDSEKAPSCPYPREKTKN